MAAAGAVGSHLRGPVFTVSRHLRGMKSLKNLRARLDLSQKELGQLLGVHVMTVSKWERGVAEPNPHQRSILRALTRAAEEGLRATPALRGRKRDPVRFLAA